MIPDRPGYNYDGCPAALLRNAKVENGDVVLPSGMRYRLLVLPSYNADGQSLSMSSTKTRGPQTENLDICRRCIRNLVDV